MRVLSLGLVALAAWAQSECPSISIAPSRDYSSISAAAGAGSGGKYRWLVNDSGGPSASSPQLLLLHADQTANPTSAVEPAISKGIEYQSGRWGSALAFASGARLAYARQRQLDPREGTVEMWVALRGSGRDQVYTSRDHVLFEYTAANGDWLAIVQASGPSGTLYAGGTVGGNWQSAWGIGADMRDWEAGEWHHLAFTWSASANRMKMFIDGALTADTNEGRYTAPPATGATFSIGGSSDGEASYYLIDEVRISGDALSDEQVRADAVRQTPFADNELFLPLGGRTAGDRISLEWTTAAGAVCRSSTYVYSGIPITGADPPSTILPPGSTSLSLSVATPAADACRYAVGSAAVFDRMKPFSAGDGTTAHRALIEGLNPDPAVVNHVFVRCAAHTDYALELLYRARGAGNAHYPRKGNLWGSWLLLQGGLEHAARIDLYLGASFTPEQVRKLRALNPNILILTSINTVENSNLPEDYYLHTVAGKRIEVWPGTYRLNLTRPYVAEYQAKLAYQLILDSGLLLDGCFFDNFFTSQSWQDHDIFGNPAQLDADEDRKPDDPAVLDAKWREGVFHELRTWRKYMPYALNSGHLPRPPDSDTVEVFNGDSIGFMVPEVKDGATGFSQLFDLYTNWYANGRPPVTMMLESAPPYQIGYGYGYDPLSVIPASTLEFARTYYPYMRFGLATTLMNDGYFAHELGDTFHGNDWWYDELDFDLGMPLGAAVRLQSGSVAAVQLVQNGGFEAPLEGTWDFWVNTAAGAQATVTRDSSTSIEGRNSARIDVARKGQGTDWHIDFHQYDRQLTKGTSYNLSFWAKASAPRMIGVSVSKQAPDWNNYGLYSAVNAGTEWKRYSVPFEALETVSNARLQFFFGEAAGVAWLDDVQLTEAPPAIYRRDFTNGIALLNGSMQRQTIEVGPGFRRLSGTQASKYEYIVDDADPGAYTAGAGWAQATYDSGMWKASGPYFHNWGPGCSRCTGAGCAASSFDLQLREDDTYTIAAWWPAAPTASSFSRSAVFELVAGGKVLASASTDQTRDGDQWHPLFTVALKAADKPAVRIRNSGAGIAIADALWVRSAARYNDGSATSTVTLEPRDGIVLRRSGDHPQVGDSGVLDAAGFSQPVAKGSWSSVFGSKLATGTRGWNDADFRGTSMPVSLDGTGVRVNGVDAPVSFISPSQVNFQVPWTVAAGSAVVQVVAPLGESNPQVVEVADAAPAFFAVTEAGVRYAVAQRADGSQAGTPATSGVAAGEVIVLWGSGFGPTNPPSPSGAVLTGPAPLAHPERLRVTVGGREAAVGYAGSTIAGVYQINVQVPAGLAAGDQTLTATLGGSTTQSVVMLRVR